MTQYADLFMRDFVGDTGQIPSTTRDAVSWSPDVIPAGPRPIQNYLSVLAANYNGPFDYYQNVQQQTYNYVYTRGFNLFPSAQSGTIALYYAPSALLLRPSIWINNVIPNANGTSSARIVSAPRNTVAVGDSPFYWQPAPLPPGQGHYCLIAQVVTAADPNPIPSDSNLLDFARWVAEHPGIAWRNVSVVSSIPAPTFSEFVGIENPSEQALFVVAARCVEIPDNTSVSLVCPTSGPVPPINYTGVVGPENQTAERPKTNVLATTSTLPEHFESKLQVTATVPNGVRPPVGAAITVSCYLATQPQEDLMDIALEPQRLRLAPERVDNGILLLLGDYTYEFRVGS